MLGFTLLRNIIFSLAIVGYSSAGVLHARQADDPQFVNEILSSTNSVRAQHGAAPLQWDTSLSQFARNHVQKCVFQHSGGPFGENLAAGFSSASASVQAWANEASQYNCNSPGFSAATGHFTQLVWKSTTRVGCAMVDCPGLPRFLACEYSPPGNIVGNNNQFFRDNVQC